jgi:hypothetical protein
VAQGRVDDDEVWRAYVELNNASFEYDEQLLDAFGEVTPWDVDAIDPDEADREFGVGIDDEQEGDLDPYPQVLSVRQRRDYRVPSVAALIRVAEAARAGAEHGEEEPGAPVETVSEAILELLQSGDGSLAALDVPELEPLDGIVAVAEVAQPLDLDSYDESDGVGPFQLREGDRLVGRLDEHPYSGLDEGETAELDDEADLDEADLDEEDLDEEDLDEDGIADELDDDEVEDAADEDVEVPRQ